MFVDASTLAPLVLAEPKTIVKDRIVKEKEIVTEYKTEYKTNNVGVSWVILAFVSVLVGVSAVAGTVFFHKPKVNTDVSDAIAKIECPVTECPVTECPKCQNLVPETVPISSDSNSTHKLGQDFSVVTLRTQHFFFRNEVVRKFSIDFHFYFHFKFNIIRNKK